MKEDRRLGITLAALYVGAGVQSLADGQISWGILLILGGGVMLVNAWRRSDGHLSLFRAAVRWLARTVGVME